VTVVATVLALEEQPHQLAPAELPQPRPVRLIAERAAVEHTDAGCGVAVPFPVPEAHLREAVPAHGAVAPRRAARRERGPRLICGAYPALDLN
jgi:hypothetical protein